MGLLTGIYNGAKRVIDLIKNNPITNLFDDGSKGLRASVPFPEEIGGGVTVETGTDFGGTFGSSSGSPTFTGAPLSAYSPAMQAAILRREELKAETARLRAQREANAESRVTVNMGVVGDPEAAARTIIDLVNKSQARGTLGAGAFLIA